MNNLILRELRGDRTQEEIAKALGITKSSWAMYERGERTPRDETKMRIAKFFGKSVEEIFFTQISTYSAQKKPEDFAEEEKDAS